MDETTREALVRRNMVLLMVAQAMLLAATGVFITLAVVEIVDLSGAKRWGGVMIAVFNLSAAGSALIVGRLMDRVGRRPGLVLAHSLYATAGLLAVCAVWFDSPWALLATAVPLGAGLGAGLLSRVAAADMVTPSRRGRIVGVLIAAGAIGAIAGPPLVAVVEHLSDSATAPWFLIPIFELIALTTVVLLRPDPRTLAPESPPLDFVASLAEGGPAEGRRLGELLRVPPIRAAIVSIGFAQASMVAVMGVSPIVIDDLGGSSLAIALVISVHMAGMFAFGPGIGALLDRFGRRLGLLLGAGVAASGALVASLTGAVPAVGLGLFLVGLGWSACYLGATAAISDLTSTAERGGALGFTDLLSASAAAGGALAGAFVLEAAGISVVGVTMAMLLGVTLLLIIPLREPAPGRWRLAGAASAESTP